MRLLEARIAKLESLLREDGHVITEEVGEPLDKDRIRNGNFPGNDDSEARRPKRFSSGSSSGSAEPGPSYESRSKNVEDDPENVSSDDEHFIATTLGPAVAGLSLDPPHRRYLGKSSGFSMIKSAIMLKAENTGTRPTCAFRSFREEFWRPQLWELPAHEIILPNYKYPDVDLMESLIRIYFDQLHYLAPCLHQQTFERKFRDGLHLSDRKFADIVLMVCAVASRYSDDERVYTKASDSSYSPQSAGWKWFTQVQAAPRSLVAPTTLEDLQLYNLLFIFVTGGQAPQVGWVIVGHALRLAQDIGAHKRKFHEDQRKLDSELWKRAFWCLIAHDRHMSAAIGRPCSIDAEEIEVDFPAECDDEYLEHPDSDGKFKQDSERPSKMVYFTHCLKMSLHTGNALRAIYTNRRYQALMGRNQQGWEQRILAEMDSASNQWFDTIPAHLRWVPTCGDPTFFKQSAFLYINYYQNQILVHRPFMASKNSALSLSCLAICTNAARCILNVADALRQRRESYPGTIVPTFTATMFLLLQAWGGKRLGISADPESAMADVHRGLRVLKHLEDRWTVAGALWDIIWELASITELPLPVPQKNCRSFKRPRHGSNLPTNTAPPPLLAEKVVAGASRSSSTHIHADPEATQSGSSVSQSQSPAPAVYRAMDWPLSSDGQSAVMSDFVQGGNAPDDIRYKPSSEDFRASSFTSATGLSSRQGYNMFGLWMGQANGIEHHAPSSSMPSGSASTFQGDPSGNASLFSGFATTMTEHGAVDSLSNSSTSTSIPSGFGQPYINAAQNGFNSPEWQSPSDSASIPRPAGGANGFDQDALTLLSNYPTGFDFDDWDVYIDSMDTLMQCSSSLSNAGGGA